MFGAIIFLPLYLQTVRHISPTYRACGSCPSGRRALHLDHLGQLISKRGRYKAFVVAGTAVMSVGMYVMSLVQVNTGALVLAGMMFVVGAGLGLFMQTLIIAVQNAISMQDMGVGTSAITFFRTLGGAIGAAVLGAVLLDQERVLQRADIAKYGKVLGAAHDFTSAMDRAFLWSVPVAVGALPAFVPAEGSQAAHVSVGRPTASACVAGGGGRRLRRRRLRRRRLRRRRLRTGGYDTGGGGNRWRAGGTGEGFAWAAGAACWAGRRQG